MESRIIIKSARKRPSRNKPKWVYALVDPRDSRVRYIGCSCEPEIRFKSHIGVAMGTTPHMLSYWHKHTPVYEWIFHLMQNNEQPLMVVLEKCELGTNYFAREDYWIHKLIEAGADLTNVRTANNSYLNQRIANFSR